MTNTPLTPESATDITAITQLVVRERESRDLCLWNRMAECFHEDSHVDISWFQGSGKEFVQASKGMFERGMRAKHRLGPVLVTLNGDKAVATLSGIIDVPEEIDGVEMTLSAHCLMIYRAEKRGGAWGLISFGAIYRRDEFIPAIPGVVADISPEKLKQFRPSYRNLSYCLELAGFEVNNELPGEDRPETVAAIMEEVFGWAGLPVPD
ncbi:MAG: nuclear transport factor 2 family protein [Gammaproteobacteria bacterium]|nr:nuclear transport factor 2 family protein [Gammaproteobacteria bacterium]